MGSGRRTPSRGCPGDTPQSLAEPWASLGRDVPESQIICIVVTDILSHGILTRGYVFVILVPCRAFSWGADGLVYDAFLVDAAGTVLTFARQGKRHMAAVQVPSVTGRFYVHRLVSERNCERR